MMKTSFNEKYKNMVPEILFYSLLFASMLFFVLIQPFGEPPDETGRYLVVQYICLNGKLPHGADPAIGLFGYGGSYAFQPILTYIIQGFLLRIIFPFCKDGYILLFAARMVNVVFGMIMAVFIRKISKLLFKENAFGWLFSVMIMFLPQSLFLHTYVNTDSMAMMSAAIMVYAWITGMKSRWDRRSCLTLCVGISLCALSYYNAYGFILCSIFIFLYSFLEKDSVSGKFTYHYREMLRKGIFISVIVLFCIGWWFIRNAVLYNGDFLGLRAREECALMTASEKYHPLTKETLQNTGVSLWHMLTGMDFTELLINSSIATFGPMSIMTYSFIYTIFKWIFLIGSVSFLCLPASCYPQKLQETAKDRLFLYGNMLLCIIIPTALCVYYSYTSDYQPQGRYILPMLIPFMYFLTKGFQKLCGLLRDKYRIIPWLIIIYFGVALFLTLSRTVFPVYYESSILYYIRHL